MGALSTHIRTLNVDTTLHNNELEMFFGPLEAAILRAIWAGNATSPKIWRHVRTHYLTGKTDEIAYTSITSTLTRLTERGIVKRSGDKRRYRYRCLYDTEIEFVNAGVLYVLWQLLRTFPDAFKRGILSMSQGDQE